MREARRIMRNASRLTAADSLAALSPSRLASREPKNLRAKFVFSVGLLGLLCLMLPGPLRADTVYTYAGNTFTQSAGTDTCPPQCSITGNFTLAAPLPANDTVWYPTVLSTLSFDFTDGSNVWTNLNSTVSQFSVETNAAGNIVEWDIIMTNTSGASLYTAFVPDAFSVNNGLFIEEVGYSPNGEVGIFDSTSMGAANYADNGSDPGGTWTTTTVPETSSSLLLAAGLLGLLGLAARSKRRSRSAAC